MIKENRERGMYIIRADAATKEKIIMSTQEEEEVGMVRSGHTPTSRPRRASPRLRLG